MKPATTDDVLDLLDAPFSAVALGTALELGLFWLLEEKPRDGAEVAETLDIPQQRCRYWLQILDKAGLIEQMPEGYKSSETTRRTILETLSQSSWALLAKEARERMLGLRDLTRYIQLSGSAWAAMGLEVPDYIARMTESPEVARSFTRMLFELHQALARNLTEFIDIQDVKSVMDLGGGSGVISMAFLRRYPDLNSTVVDITNVCAAGQEIATEQLLQERITFHPANFLKDELPLGFDMVLECDVGVYSEALFCKVLSALNPRGRFVIVDQFSPAEGVAPPSRVHWAFEGSLRDPEFVFLTADQVEDLLLDAGFKNISRHVLPPFQDVAARFSIGMYLIEACK